MSSITVLLAEDHTVVRKGLLYILENEPGITILGEAENGREAIQKAETLQPDIVLMDIGMPELNGLEATRQIRQRWPEIQVLILTMHATEEYVYQVLEAGAAGYVVKKAAPEELITAIRTVKEGQAYLSPEISSIVIERVRRGGSADANDSLNLLTDREREVLQLLAEGYTNQEIANKLVVAASTVAVHRFNLMRKLDLHTTADLVKYAIQKSITGVG